MLESDVETISFFGLSSDDVQEIFKSFSQNLVSNRALHGGGLHLLTVFLFVVEVAFSFLHGLNVASVVHV